MSDKKEVAKPASVNLNEMTDVKELKAMVYDKSKELAGVQRDIQMIENRIGQLQQNGIQV